MHQQQTLARRLGLRGFGRTRPHRHHLVDDDLARLGAGAQRRQGQIHALGRSHGHEVIRVLDAQVAQLERPLRAGFDHPALIETQPELAMRRCHHAANPCHRHIVANRILAPDFGECAVVRVTLGCRHRNIDRQPGIATLLGNAGLGLLACQRNGAIHERQQVFGAAQHAITSRVGAFDHHLRHVLACLRGLEACTVEAIAGRAVIMQAIVEHGEGLVLPIRISDIERGTLDPACLLAGAGLADGIDGGQLRRQAQRLAHDLATVSGIGSQFRAGITFDQEEIATRRFGAATQIERPRALGEIVELEHLCRHLRAFDAETRHPAALGGLGRAHLLALRPGQRHAPACIRRPQQRETQLAVFHRQCAVPSRARLAGDHVHRNQRAARMDRGFHRIRRAHGGEILWRASQLLCPHLSRCNGCRAKPKHGGDDNGERAPGHERQVFLHCVGSPKPRWHEPAPLPADTSEPSPPSGPRARSGPSRRPYAAECNPQCSKGGKRRSGTPAIARAMHGVDLVERGIQRDELLAHALDMRSDRGIVDDDLRLAHQLLA